jgi:peptide/nickel transport system substrate-binding protein
VKRLRTIVAACATATFIAASCSRPATPPATATAAPTSTATAIPHGDAIRFALIGDVTAQNVWSLFDAQGYSYNNYAVQADYWPRLFQLSLPDGQLVSEAASGVPTRIQQDGGFYTATVPVRTDLTWSDGSAFGAQDVAFTVNTVLKFKLGFDWQDYYNAQWLDHAEALTTDMVEFFFKKLPNVEEWQYGALLGPIVQERYWTPKVADAAALLPSADLTSSMEELQAQIDADQARVDALYGEAATAQGETVRQVQASLKREQGNLDEAMNNLAASQAQFDESMKQARASLYAADDADEPRLGRWKNETGKAEMQPGGSIENMPSAAFQDVLPHFDRAVYLAYATRAAALAALSDGKADVVLDPTATGQDSGASQMMDSPSRRLRFLALNSHSGPFAQTALRQALACVVDQQALQSESTKAVAALTSFVPTGEVIWNAPEARLPCDGLDAATRKSQAIEMLRAAGYSWEVAPSAQDGGQALKAPDGEGIEGLQLLSTASDAEDASASAYVERQARTIGIPLTVKATTGDVIDYSVLGSGQFDAAILGWTVSRYPGYLCDWFGAGRPFQYKPGRVLSLCGELQATSDLAAAQAKLGEIQDALAQEVPMIPLYADIVHDAFLHVKYPFDSVLGGLAANYGVPNLAMPGAP